MMPAHRIIDMPHVEGAMESWARWCLTAGAPREISNTGRIMAGGRSGICAAWLRDYLRGKSHNPHCPDCRGRGRIRAHSTLRKINPVCIRSTREAGGWTHTDLCTAIDELVCGWITRDETVWLHNVAMAEYLPDIMFRVSSHLMRQEDKARRLRISRSYYSRQLNEVHHRVSVLLHRSRL